MTTPRKSRFFKEAKLMLEVLPFVAQESCFALKGGTAINLFLRDLPRLSVDIDLTYLPIEDRNASLAGITAALRSVINRISRVRSNLKVQTGKLKGTETVTKLFVSDGETQIKVEPNLVLRGTLFPTETHHLSAAAEKTFETAVQVTTVSKADIYGGKLCAALDRQHPRDLFDVKLLLEIEGLTEEIRKGFLIYLVGHDETMSQLLSPERRDIRQQFTEEFTEMPVEPVTLEALLDTREKLVTTINDALTKDERKFLLSIKERHAGMGSIGCCGRGTPSCHSVEAREYQKDEARTSPPVRRTPRRNFEGMTGGIYDSNPNNRKFILAALPAGISLAICSQTTDVFQKRRDRRPRT